MIVKLAGIACILVAMFQIYSAYRLFVDTKKSGNQNTSHFLLICLWSGVLVGIILFIVGLGLILNVL